MARITILFGVLLILLGFGVFSLVHPHAPTSLIPAYFGVVLALLGFLAQTEDTKRRALVMHIAVTIGLVGFFFPFLRSIGGTIRMLKGNTVLHPLAVQESMAMAVLCLIFTGLCIRSFIVARRTRLA